MAVILSEREKMQWNEIKTLAKDSNFFMLEDKDVVRMKRILDLLKNQGYIQDTDVGGTNIFLIVGNFQDFDDWLKDEENKQMSIEWESKRKFDEETQRMAASSIVNGQPFVNGMRIMDAASEEILAAILKTYDGNESRHVHGSIDDIPVPYATTLISELQKLRMYGVVTSIHANIFGAWEATLTPQGLSYFDDKEKALKAAAVVERTPTKPTRKEFDVFISHANKDKLSYVNDLNKAIKNWVSMSFMILTFCLGVIISNKLFLMVLQNPNLLSSLFPKTFSTDNGLNENLTNFLHNKMQVDKKLFCLCFTALHLMN